MQGDGAGAVEKLPGRSENMEPIISDDDGDAVLPITLHPSERDLHI